MSGLTHNVSAQANELLDHIYEYGTNSEGVISRINSLCDAAVEQLRAELAASPAARQAAGYARGLKDAGSVLGVERGILEAALHGDAKPAKCDGNHGGPRCADPECWQDPAGAVIYVRMEAERLVKSALAVGVVLTIDTQPRQPLAMGNYDLLVQTREVRNG